MGECVQRCEACPFKTRLCGSKGPEDSPFVIVGESPGTNEIRAGLPFVGESGKLLNAVLESVGLNSLGIEPYILNALQCYPPPSAKQNGSNKMQEATRACQPRLIEAITKHPRKVILCLGAAASWSVTNNFGIKITQSRGRVLPSPYAENGVVLAVHPAFLMRQGGGLTFWKKDLGSAVKLLRGESLSSWREPTWGLVQTPSQIIDLIAECHNAKDNTADIETDQLHWYTIPNHPDPNCRGRILCIGLTRGDGSHVDIIPEDVIYKNLHLIRRLFSKGRWSFHNALFDVTWLAAPQHKVPILHAIERGDVELDDTMLMSYALNENRGFHGLDQVAQSRIGASPHKGMVEKYLPRKDASYRNIPPEVLYKYNAIDLSKQHCILAPLREELRECEHASKLYNKLLVPAIPEIVHLRLQGVKVNTEKVHANEDRLTKKLADFDAQINEYANKHIGAPINVASPQQLAHLLYDKMGLKIPGNRSTNEETMIQLQRRYDHPIFNIILNRREVAKQKGTYVTNMLEGKLGSKKIAGLGHIKPDGRVYPDFRLHGTTTGRLAGSDPNLLNQPRDAEIRGQYEAEPGKLFVEVDENQAELRSLAVMSNDPVLIDIYTKNEVSIHDITTSAFYGSKEAMHSSPEVLAKAIHLLQYYGDDQSPEKVYKEAKMRGKAVNFGIVYGREAYSLAMEFNISVHEAQRWIDTWFETYPKAAEFIQWCRSRPVHARDLVTVFGRKKRHGVISRERLKAIQNEAANFPHQSTASDIMLETLIRCGPILRKEYGAQPWLELYDAVYYQIDIDEERVANSIRLVQNTIQAIPIEYGMTRIPFIGDAKIGFDWGHMKDWKGSIAATLGEDAIKERLAA
jgi:uracil-DNA glycosylase family 4